MSDTKRKQAKPIPKELIQSYLLTTAKYDFTTYEKRILYRIVEALQPYQENKEIGKDYSITEDLFEESCTLTIPTIFLKKDIAEAEDKNNEKIKDALDRLRKKSIIYLDEKGGRTGVGIIDKWKIPKGSKTATLRIDKVVFDAFLSFSKGYSKYELNTALSFESKYTMRFYELMASQTKPINYSIETLKKMFGIETKYKNRPQDFAKNVLNVAKKELDEKSYVSFKATPIKEGGVGKTTGFTLVPIKTKNPNPLEGKNKVRTLNTHKTSLSMMFNDVNIFKALRDKFEFTDEEIRNNFELLSTAEKAFDLLSFISEKKAASRGKENPKGYFIGSVKGKLTDNGKLLQHTIEGNIDII